jgi:hypothetical protein
MILISSEKHTASHNALAELSLDKQAYCHLPPVTKEMCCE